MNGDDKPARNMAEAISQEARAHRENAAKNMYFGTVALVAFVLCLLATLYPAWRASRTDPATALRYE